MGYTMPSDQVNKLSNTDLNIRSEKEKTELFARLSRIEGQVRGIKGMVEKDVYCDDVLNQISSIQAAMNSVSCLILNNHLKSCLVAGIQSGETDVANELLHSMEKIMK